MKIPDSTFMQSFVLFRLIHTGMVLLPCATTDGGLSSPKSATVSAPLHRQTGQAALPQSQSHLPSTAAEAIEVILVQLQAGVSVIVERAANHPGAIDFQPIVFGGLPNRDRRLDCFKMFICITSLIFLDDFFICLNIRRKTLSTEKSGTSAKRKAKKPPENLKKCKFRDGSVHTKLVDIVP